MREGLSILIAEDKVYSYLKSQVDHNNSNLDPNKPEHITPTLEEEKLRNNILTTFSETIVDALKDAPSLNYKDVCLIKRVEKLAKFFNLSNESQKLHDLYFSLADRMDETPSYVKFHDSVLNQRTVSLIEKLPKSLFPSTAEKAIEILFDV